MVNIKLIMEKSYMIDIKDFSISKLKSKFSDISTKTIFILENVELDKPYTEETLDECIHYYLILINALESQYIDIGEILGIRYSSIHSRYNKISVEISDFIEKLNNLILCLKDLAIKKKLCDLQKAEDYFDILLKMRSSF